MRAEAEAQPEDIITLLVDAEEVVTNEKEVTLDLNNHTVTGSLTNTTAGNLTIINGEINNPNGAAVTNNGILTLGVDDYDDEGIANVINDNVRLIGTTAGLMQTNNTYQLYYYDGYLEGDLGLVGGYDGSPFYRRAYDGVEVHYFPFVEHHEQGERNYQHIELKNADNAVTKTSVHGDIYYYNVQDNIDISAITGYKIYAVRNFDASYPITISANEDIELDLVNYTVNFGDVLTNNGTLNFCSDNRQGVANFSRTIINNGNLTFCNVEAKTVSANKLIENRKNLTLQNATLSSEHSLVLDILVDGTTLTMDDDSYISASGNAVAIHNTASDFVISSGHVTSESTAIQNQNSGSSITVTGGEVRGRTGIWSDDGAVNVSGGKVHCTVNPSNNDDNFGGDCFGIYAGGGSAITITGGEISATVSKTGYSSSSANVAAIYTRKGYLRWPVITVRGGTIKESLATTSGSIDITSAIMLDEGVAANIYDGATIEADNTAHRVYAINGNKGNLTVYGGNISAQSSQGDSYGVSVGNLTMSGGEISSTSPADKTGIGASNRTSSITGGKITGSQYGLSSGKVTLGANDGTISITSPEIVGGDYAVSNNSSINFYDGILRGTTGACDGRRIKDIATESAEKNDSSSIDGVTYNNKYLIAAYNVAQIGSTKYTSLANAIAAVQPNEIIELIDDNYIYSQLEIPNAVKATIDLNGHKILAANAIKNNGDITITDSQHTNNTLDYFESDYLFQNSLSAKLTIDGISVESSRIISGGDITLSRAKLSSDISSKPITTSGLLSITDNSTVNAPISYTGTSLTVSNSTFNRTTNSDTALIDINNNSCISIITSSTFNSDRYSAISQTKGNTTTVSDSTITGSIDNGSGAMTLNNLDISASTIGFNYYSYFLISNHSTLNADDIRATLPLHNAYTNSSSYSFSILYNTGTATIANSTLKAEMSGTKISSSVHAILNLGGTLNYTNSSATIKALDSITTSSKSATGIHNTGTVNYNSGSISVEHSTNTSYAIYNTTENAQVSILSGDLSASGTTAYGIYIDNGEVTLGEAEPTTSPNYGTANADVSTTAPAITAIGSQTGIGIKKNVGKFNYYDGIITGSTEAKPELPTKIEYLYEAKNYTDDNNHQYCILEYMR